MKDPMPINLTTPAEMRAAGWAAESRDDDGHLCTTHVAFGNDAEMLEYIKEEIQRGKTVTIWPDI